MELSKENRELVRRALEKLDSIDNNISELKETLIRVSMKQDHDRERLEKVEMVVEELRLKHRECPAKKQFYLRQDNRKSLSWWFGAVSILAAFITALTAIIQIIIQKV